MKTAHEQWLEYADAIGIGLMDPRATQYVETRRAFYGGMYAMLSTVHAQAAEAPDTEEGERLAGERLEVLRQEIVAFYERVRSGLA